jgi:RNA polymerase sigma-70 factor (ECF subfamily)
MDATTAIDLAKNNSQKGFTFLYNKYYNVIYRNILYIVKQREIAEDLTSETFLKAFKNIEKFEKDISFEMWLRTIGNNHSIDYIRKKKREDALFAESDEEEEINYSDKSTPEFAMIDKEEVKLLSTAISKMRGREQLALKLRIYNEMSYKEISEKLGCSIGAVKSYIHKAKAKLSQVKTQQNKKSNEEKSILFSGNKIIG